MKGGGEGGFGREDNGLSDGATTVERRRRRGNWKSIEEEGHPTVSGENWKSIEEGASVFH